VAFKPEPPHDCRITLRCLKETFGFRLPPDRDFASLRSDNSLIDRFFARREDDEQGGEGGERVQQIRTKPAFKLTSGRMRGATWFDKGHPPQGIVWLLGAEQHDERHKGARDAYDILGALDAQGVLFPQPIDYKRLELDRRRWDTESFAEDVIRDGQALFEAARESRTAKGALVGVPSRMVLEEEGGLVIAHVAVSAKPVKGARSGLDFPLTQQRFVLMTQGVRQAVEAVVGTEVLGGESAGGFPGGVKNERSFALMWDMPESAA
jgi:hypothetical protein